ncbi:hypothetical protein B0T26DRAFT_683159 [Lasiosphaeria miniovina]|uniref:Uncharacterized protein n=1 Tax=Lasiosphaeria miniovina TaxID=1954250 RepID=A0AA40BFE8_9PEZI|nr:uncharacterized protein B0T26DRAFT_683159 [Lasiosphaeria miniovina]KAK0733224.1 hypothetical protein B0T26DRAFT_683159 [Lasiosphaeria miniovina]
MSPNANNKLGGGPSLLSLPLFGGPTKKEKALEAELQDLKKAHAAELRASAQSLHQQRTALQATMQTQRASQAAQRAVQLATERTQQDTIRSQGNTIQTQQDTIRIQEATLETQIARARALEEQLQGLEYQHTLRISQMQHDLDEARRQLGLALARTASRGDSESDSSANDTPRASAGSTGDPLPEQLQTLLEKEKPGQGQPEKGQPDAKTLARLVDEVTGLRAELERRKKELVVKDNRLEWMQQRAAALARGDTESPFVKYFF